MTRAEKQLSSPAAPGIYWVILWGRRLQGGTFCHKPRGAGIFGLVWFEHRKTANRKARLSMTETLHGHRSPKKLSKVRPSSAFSLSHAPGNLCSACHDFNCRWHSLWQRSWVSVIKPESIEENWIRWKKGARGVGLNFFFFLLQEACWLMAQPFWLRI